MAWVKTQGGQKGLAAKFKRKFGKDEPISQTVISNWVTRRKVPDDRRKQLEVFGWHGPWEWPTEDQDSAAPAHVTREEFGALKEKLKETRLALRGVIEILRLLGKGTEADRLLERLE